MSKISFLYYSFIKRLFDFTFSFFLLLFFLFPFIIISLFIKLTSKGPILFWSERVGINNTIFKMPKFRTMKIGTPVVATDQLPNPINNLTPIGSFLRKSSLDELPQIWSIFLGHMSFVGPRPSLFNQYDLILLRTNKNIHNIIPGLTGWAQVNGRDNISIEKKLYYDEFYLNIYVSDM
jgi:O-antigen biosynthesis protein WbqP